MTLVSYLVTLDFSSSCQEYYERSSGKSAGWKDTGLKEADLVFSCHEMRQVTAPVIKMTSLFAFVGRSSRWRGVQRGSASYHATK